MSEHTIEEAAKAAATANCRIWNDLSPQAQENYRIIVRAAIQAYLAAAGDRTEPTTTAAEA